MKIEIFPDRFESTKLDGERLAQYLRDIKSNLTVSYCADQGDNYLFSKTVVLAELVQRLWNDLEEMKEALKRKTEKNEIRN